MKQYLVKYHDYENKDHEKIVNENEIDYTCEVLAHMIDSIKEIKPND